MYLYIPSGMNASGGNAYDLILVIYMEWFKVSKQIILTEEGLKNLESELENLKTVKRK